MSKTLNLQMPQELVLGSRLNHRVPEHDQRRQLGETQEILKRLVCQPGVILANEVGMGKTYVALAVAYAIATQNLSGPVIVMVPPNLIDKWKLDLCAFCELYLDGITPVDCGLTNPSQRRGAAMLRYGSARHSIELLKLLDDRRDIRPYIIFLGQGAMSRSQSDPWIRLALIRETLRRHGRRHKLARVKKTIHRHMARLLRAKGRQRASEDGDHIWERLLKADPCRWKDLFNNSLGGSRKDLLDDPVPASVSKAIGRLDLSDFADVLAQMPVRDSKSINERIAEARESLKEVESDVWNGLLTAARWRSPLLIMDEAHHLKNPKTALARQFQHPDAEADLKTGDGALSRSFARMLFLTATPFQLGHNELVRVLDRFSDVRWDKAAFGERGDYTHQMRKLSEELNQSQRASVTLHRCWSRLRPQDQPDGEPVSEWWARLVRSSREMLSQHQLALLGAFEQAVDHRDKAEKRLRPWVIRHNKGLFWHSTDMQRRQRFDGQAMTAPGHAGGIEIPEDQMLAFFLAARSATEPGKDLLGEALCSSYEAFRLTRRENHAERDDTDHEDNDTPLDPAHGKWYLKEFDRALDRHSGSVHPKIASTVDQAVRLWSLGEKVLIFAFYRQTCRALRLHISQAIEAQVMTHARRRLAGAHKETGDPEIERILDSIQNRFFDQAEAPGRRALDQALREILDRRDVKAAAVQLDAQTTEQVVAVMRRFLRVMTTLVRAFPIHQHDSLSPTRAVQLMLDSQDNSGISWRKKFDGFLDFLLNSCTTDERHGYLESAARTQTGAIRLTKADDFDDHEEDPDEAAKVLANVQEATGRTTHEKRTRLMRSFNTPFFPDILVCSQVMGEGVDLHRSCRHVIHHDLAWNPSSIEQRTGRVDRLGCKAEGTHPIHVYLPYLSGTADERQYRVMTDRESWFQVVMGQAEVAKLIPEDIEVGITPPEEFAQRLSFNLTLKPR